MSADASVVLTWGDDEYLFRLRIGQLRELQEKCGTGPFAVYKRLENDSWLIDDLREPIRLGLVGGGMRPEQALVLVRRYVDDRPLIENVLTARSILLAAIIGVPGDPVGKPVPEETQTEEATSSSSPRSTEPAERSAGRRARSTSAASGSSLQP